MNEKPERKSNRIQNYDFKHELCKRESGYRRAYFVESICQVSE